MPIVVGAGSVGLALGARLARAGEAVVFLTRRASAARALAADGVVVEDPETGATWSRPARATTDPAEIAAGEAAPTLLLTVRADETDRVGRELARVLPGATAVSVQNGVDNDALLAARFGRVLGIVWRHRVTVVAESRVLLPEGGRWIVGAHADSGGPDVEQLARQGRAAGFDVGVTADLASDRWLKLCVNLLSGPNALVRRDEHAGAPFAALKRSLLEEARDVLAAAGIRVRSCDGRDRSLAEEIAACGRDGPAQAMARASPLRNSVWTAARRGAPLEPVLYHRRVIGLAERHALDVPVNRAVLRAMLRVERQRLGPESLSVADLLDARE